MTVISKSTIDTRTISMVLFGIGGTPTLLGIIGLNLAVLFSGIGIISIGLLIFFFGKSTYSVSYDEKSERFILNSRQDSVTINKSDVISVKKRITFFQTWWPLNRHYYYTLTAKNKLGKKTHYRFVIWSNQPGLKLNYDMLKRSVESWTKAAQAPPQSF